MKGNYQALQGKYLLVCYLSFLILGFLGCRPKKNKQRQINSGFHYQFLAVRVRDEIRLDTLYRRLDNQSFEDGIYHITYSEIYQDSVTFSRDYYFNTLKNSYQKDGIEIKLLKKRNLSYKNKTYVIYHYFENDLQSNDEEMQYFFTPKFGILIEKAAAWGNYRRLINIKTAQDEKNIIFGLCEKIISDCNFFDIDRY